MESMSDKQADSSAQQDQAVAARGSEVRTVQEQTSTPMAAVDFHFVCLRCTSDKASRAADDHHNNSIPGGQIRAQLRPSVVIGYVINAPSRLLSATGHPLARTHIYLCTYSLVIHMYFQLTPNFHH
ncbi:hypothetical protein CY34DRAFT_165218 [Suillus luteus UH-Slu-Lm8-n1]|uniref:Uncharacterized protein n=1 Tax=Suillus luteus UH-Slu-Lm8-n1 TaxID=930992 RepID=A0A0D0A259_9AGAM|nr:hypothetical protein CY34DRAFT_165218 [Suillus luteus UH-Slu-Lm8-n1]